MAIRVPGAPVAAAVAVPAPDPRARMRRANGPPHAAPVAVAELHVLPSVAPEDPATTNAAAQVQVHAAAGPHHVQEAIGHPANAAARMQVHVEAARAHHGREVIALATNALTAVARNAKKAAHRAVGSAMNAVASAPLRGGQAADGTIALTAAHKARNDRSAVVVAKDRAARAAANPSARGPTAGDHHARNATRRRPRKARLRASCA